MGRVHGETQGVGSRAHTSDMGRIIGVLVLLLALVVAVVSSSPLQKLTDGSGSCGKEGAVCSMLDCCPGFSCEDDFAARSVAPQWLHLSVTRVSLTTPHSVWSSHHSVLRAQYRALIVQHSVLSLNSKSLVLSTENFISL